MNALNRKQFLSQEVYLTFDDFLLVPQFSEVLPKNVSVETRLTQTLNLSIPVIGSAMDTVTESKMAIALAQNGGLGIIHTNMSSELQTGEVKKVKNKNSKLLVGAAIGATNDFLDRALALADAGVDTLAIDTAHGHSKNVLDAITTIKKKLNIPLIAGNVATGEGARAIYEAGAEVVKVGIGPGSICTTRIVSGVGVPQAFAIAEAAESLEGKNITIIADGGIRYAGDIAKALALGAHAVMLGSLLAGTHESPGKEINFKGRKFKSYRGMGSIGAMERGSADRYFQDSQSDPEKFVPEGVEGMVPYSGKVEDVLFQLVGGLRSSMGYTGSKDLATFQKRAKFIRLTESSIRESHPHDIYGVNSGE